MSCMEDAICGMMSPYGGNMPMFRGDMTDATVTIVQESTDDGMSITRIQTPPHTKTSSVMEAINEVLNLFGGFCPTTEDDGQKTEDSSDKPDASEKKRSSASEAFGQFGGGEKHDDSGSEEKQDDDSDDNDRK